MSTREQDSASQEAQLGAAGAQRVYVDHGVSSRIADRPEWQALLDCVRSGDTLVVYRLDRIAGTLADA